MTVVTGTAYEIVVSAYASVDSRATSGSMMTAEAIADPMIGFAPGFDATGYSIELSAGIENRLAPEPAVPWLTGDRADRARGRPPALLAEPPIGLVSVVLGP